MAAMCAVGSGVFNVVLTMNLRYLAAVCLIWALILFVAERFGDPRQLPPRQTDD